MHPNAKLTGEQRDEIRRRYAAGELQRDLAREYGVAQCTISFVCNPIGEENKRADSRAWKRARYGVDQEYTERVRAANRRWHVRRREARAQQAAE